MRASTAPERIEELVEEPVVVTDVPWIALVWNDPVNLMTSVVYVLQ